MKFEKIVNLAKKKIGKMSEMFSYLLQKTN